MKFPERFNIDVDLEEAKRRFVNRAYNLVIDKFVWEFNSPVRRELMREVITAIGEKYDSDSYLDLKQHVTSQLGEDFLMILQALEALYRTIPSLYIHVRPQLEALIRRLLDESEVDLGIRWENGQFVRSGAVFLDEKLVNDTLHWLRSHGYETILEPYCKGLSHFFHAWKRPELLADVITDTYEALESLAKITTQRPDRDLSGNCELFFSKVKASPEYKQLLKDYTDYANRFRHAAQESRPRPELSTKEVESFVYLTGLSIRLAMPLSTPESC